MRLLNVHTRRLEEFFSGSLPAYAILSHTWGSDEVTFQQLGEIGYQSRQGYAKIDGSCKQAAKDNLDYIWIDACCIDKTSSAELSEAINSMYRFYADAVVCYAFLADVLPDDHELVSFWNHTLYASRWFTRGWTLQELLAPSQVQFFNQDWHKIGNRSGLAREVSEITGIEEDILCRRCRVEDACLARRMSWASKRTTTRVEDMAYCLLGLLGVRMPPLYGEGERAFVRLQEEVMKGSTDQSLLAWGYGVSWSPSGKTLHQDVLADSPNAFEHGGDLRRSPREKTPHFSMTNRGLHIYLQLRLIDQSACTYLALLDCHSHSHGKRLAIPLHRAQGSDVFTRAQGSRPILVSRSFEDWRLSGKRIYIADSKTLTSNYTLTAELQIHPLLASGFNLSSYYPPDSLDLTSEPNVIRASPRSRMFRLDINRSRQDTRKFLLEFTRSGNSVLVYVEACWTSVDGELQDLRAFCTRNDGRSCLEHLLQGYAKVSFDETFTLNTWNDKIYLMDLGPSKYIISLLVDVIRGKIGIDYTQNDGNADYKAGKTGTNFDEDHNLDRAMQDRAKEQAGTYLTGIQDFLLLGSATSAGREEISYRVIESLYGNGE